MRIYIFQKPFILFSILYKNDVQVLNTLVKSSDYNLWSFAFLSSPADSNFESVFRYQGH